MIALPGVYTLGEISDVLNASRPPYQDRRISNIWNINEAQGHQLTFWTGNESPPPTSAGGILVSKETYSQTPHTPGGHWIVVDNPRLAALKMAEWFNPDWGRRPDSDWVKGVIPKRQGEGCTIGGPGHGYEKVDGIWTRIPHIGFVQFGPDVQIGNQVNIDRGTFSHTVVAVGTVIDSQVHIAHNCKIGAHNFIAAGATFSGSVATGTDVWIGTGAIIMQGVTIGKNATIGVGAVVLRDVEPGQTIVGHHRVIPTKDHQPGVTR